MSNTDEVRWHQRLNNFGSTLSQLDEACEQDTYSKLELAGLVQTFEFSFELACKTLKDLLSYEGYDVKTPRETIRTSFEAEYLNEEDCETFIDALDKRNLLSHTYREEVARQAEKLIKQQYHPMLGRLRQTLEQRHSR